MTDDYIKSLKESTKAIKEFGLTLEDLKYVSYVDKKHNKARKLRFIARQKKKKKR